MKLILEKLEMYREKNGFEHTNYSAKKDSSGDIRAIAFSLPSWLGKFTIERDIATRQLVFKDFSKMNLVFLAYFSAMTSYSIQETSTSPLMYSLFFASLIIFVIIFLLRELKIADLKRFLFE